MAQNNVIELVMRLKDGVTAPLARVRNSLSSLGGAALALGGIASVGSALVKTIRATADAEQAVLQLDQAYRVFGSRVGQTRDALLRFSAEAQKRSIFGDEQITRAQAALLRFRNLSADTFNRAREVALDLASAMGTDLESAAQTVGRALERPSIALRQLRQYGVIFTADQEKMIRAFETTGQTGRAAAVVLSELERRFTGAAQEARNTLGGALKGLSNAFSDLFEASTKSTKTATESVNNLTKVLQDPSVVKGLSVIVSVLVTIIAKAIEAIAKLGELFAVGAESLTSKAAQLRAARAELATLGNEERDDPARRERLLAEIRLLEREVELERQRAVGAGGPVSGRRYRPRSAAAQEDDDETDVGFEPFYKELSQLERIESNLRFARRDIEDVLKEGMDESLGEALRDTWENVERVAQDALGNISKYFDAAAEQAAESFKPLSDLADSIGSGIGNAISQGGLNGLTSLRDIVKQALRNIVADIVSSGISNALKKQFLAASTGESGGGLLGSLVKGLSSMFGFGKAGGGLSSGLTLVGEFGPELVRYPAGTMRVYNRAQIESMMPRAAAPITITPVNTINVQGDISERNQALVLAAIEQGNARTMREVLRMLERNGLRRPV